MNYRFHDLKYKFKYYWQKVFNKNHMPYAEAWDLHSYLSEWLLPRVHHLKNNSIGYPIGLTPETWRYILGEIEFACVFNIYEDWDETTKLQKKLIQELILEPYGDIREYLSGDFIWKDRDDGLVELDSSGIIEDTEKRELYFSMFDRMREGAKLIGEYYFNLWD